MCWNIRNKIIIILIYFQAKQSFKNKCALQDQTQIFASNPYNIYFLMICFYIAATIPILLQGETHFTDVPLTHSLSTWIHSQATFIYIYLERERERERL
jgi:hypothetical protein